MTQSLELLTTKQLATYLNKPVNTIRGWRHRKVGPAGFKLGRDVVYRRTNVDAWLAECEREFTATTSPQSGASPVYQPGETARNDEAAGYQPAASVEQSAPTAK